LLSLLLGGQHILSPALRWKIFPETTASWPPAPPASASWRSLSREWIADSLLANRACKVLLQIVGFLEKIPRYHGAYPHFLNGYTAENMLVFGMYDNGGDLVETVVLMEGLLSARQYFKGPSDTSRVLYRRITNLWEAVEWDWYRRSPQNDALLWHWSPQWSWFIDHRLTGFNETMITYLLAIASPTHAVPAELYYSGWAGQSPAAVAYRSGWSGSTEGDRYLERPHLLRNQTRRGRRHRGAVYFSLNIHLWASIPAAFMTATQIISRTTAILRSSISPTARPTPATFRAMVPTIGV
jgi:hypothetical protein